MSGTRHGSVEALCAWKSLCSKAESRYLSSSCCTPKTSTTKALQLQSRASNKTLLFVEQKPKKVKKKKKAHIIYLFIHCLICFIHRFGLFFFSILGWVSGFSCLHTLKILRISVLCAGNRTTPTRRGPGSEALPGCRDDTACHSITPLQTQTALHNYLMDGAVKFCTNIQRTKPTFSVTVRPTFLGGLVIHESLFLLVLMWLNNCKLGWVSGHRCQLCEFVSRLASNRRNGQLDLCLLSKKEEEFWWEISSNLNRVQTIKKT